MKTCRLLSLLLLLLSSVEAQDMNAAEEESYIDSFHKDVSARVNKWSTYADESLVDMADYLDGKEHNVSQLHESVVENNKNAVDSFFLNDKYLDESDKSYVSIRPDARFSSKEDADFNLKVSAHLALSKSKKRFKLFINDLDQDNAKNIATDDNDKEESAPEIGLNYFAPETYGIQSKYSIGIRGIYPFARVRYSSEFNAGEWIIEPIQTFRYSVKDYFLEETQVFFDTKITDLSLFRVYLARGTKSSVPGMSYDGSISMYLTPAKGIGLNLNQSFNGSTKYQHTHDENANPVVYEDFNGIYNYATSLSLRQNFYRKWLFYEVQPGINFHKQYDYEPNYTIRVFFDIFFGNI
jgi:hypothetical protein